MTSSVKVSAHCAKEKHVRIQVMLDNGEGIPSTLSEEFFLEDGESKDLVFYDNKYVISREILK